MKEIILPIYGIKVSIDEKGGGIIKSELYIDSNDKEDDAYNSAIDGIEAMILACACAGIDIEDKRFIEAITTSVEAVANNK